ncbi:hypothetical protein CO173_04205 [Candidatus Uhrbacteria bacterium CG_4_9_14_3_um_filter_41_35]|uniref:Uncharacterized protein n=1 Tax=Candidatus Uhrbacteria bacterium CG_4_9_14_3_um_filter_41_35 TaxID=1975034 RepID=A0A2M7XDH6_9BACT|nr:MAG: hypothetical protein COV92_02480 [Candidatus Uhrbacteria bacterium CG11_big_fil_rev_8_21_14_0_20_41_9]PJA45938.1 MAG: hypothetical protein CO173_04205 [Candidatus Uhrbacteria bacterium CG_4_9_14_3_um_filter_41_35]
MSQIKMGLRKLRGLMQKRKAILIFGIVVLGISAFASTFAQVGTVTGSGAVDAGLATAMIPMNLLIMALALIYTLFGQLMGMLISMAIGLIVVPILGYNSFGDSAIISIGWPLVRDIVNMFVIVILLVIAIKTMLGVGNKDSSAVSQQLVRFFIAIVAVNFSRTISVLAIDASQVVMFTFVNAIRDKAAGNFINLFQLQSLFSWDGIYDKMASGAGLGPSAYLITSYLILMILAMVFMVLAIMATVFLYRIVILWVLVILSPIAFFMMGIKDVIPSAGGMAEKWISKFTGALMVGPILVFFLWLGLAVASQGSIATTENFPSGGNIDGASQVFSDIFQLDKMLSMIIGLILMVVGFQAASESASKLGNFAGGLINEGAGMGLLKKAAMAPALATIGAGAAAGAAGYRTGAFVGNQLDRRLGTNSERASTQLGRMVVESGGDLMKGNIVAQAFGKGLVKGGGALEKAGSAMTEQDLKNSQERIAGMTDSQKKALRESVTNPDGLQGHSFALSQSNMDDAKLLAAEYALDTKAQENDIRDGTEKYKQQAIRTESERLVSEENMDPNLALQTATRGVNVDEAREKAEQDVEKQLAPFDALSDTEKKNLVGESKANNLFAAQVGRLHTIDVSRKRPDGTMKSDEQYSNERVEAMEAKLKTGEVTPSMFTARALADPDVLRVAEKTLVPNQFDKDGKTMSIADVIRAGKAGPEAKKAIDGPPNFKKGRVGGIKEGLEKKVLNPVDLTADDLNKPGRLNQITEGIAQSKADVGQLEKEKPEVAGTLRSELDRKIAEQQMIVDNKELVDFDKPNGETKTKQYSDGVRRSALKKIQEYKQSQFALSSNAEAASVLQIDEAGNLPASELTTLGEVVKNTPIQVGKLADVVSANGSTPITSGIVSNITDDSIEEMRKEYNDSASLGKTQKMEDIERSLKVHKEAMEKEISILQREKPGTRYAGKVVIPAKMEQARNRLRTLRRDVNKMKKTKSASAGSVGTSGLSSGGTGTPPVTSSGGGGTTPPGGGGGSSSGGGARTASHAIPPAVAEATRAYVESKLGEAGGGAVGDTIEDTAIAAAAAVAGVLASGGNGQAASATAASTEPPAVVARRRETRPRPGVTAATKTETSGYVAPKPTSTVSATSSRKRTRDAKGAGWQVAGTPAKPVVTNTAQTQTTTQNPTYDQIVLGSAGQSARIAPKSKIVWNSSKAQSQSPETTQVSAPREKIGVAPGSGTAKSSGDFERGADFEDVLEPGSAGVKEVRVKNQQSTGSVQQASKIATVEVDDAEDAFKSTQKPLGRGVVQGAGTAYASGKYSPIKPASQAEKQSGPAPVVKETPEERAGRVKSIRSSSKNLMKELQTGKISQEEFSKSLDTIMTTEIGRETKAGTSDPRTARKAVMKEVARAMKVKTDTDNNSRKTFAKNALDQIKSGTNTNDSFDSGSDELGEDDITEETTK